MIESEKIELKDGNLIYFPQFFNEMDSIHFFNYLRNEITFEQHKVKIFGKIYETPRLESFHAKIQTTYTYSRNTLPSKLFSETLHLLCAEVEKATNTVFNCVLVNYYRDGQDSNGWHADNEKELGPNPKIASLSFGASRRFDLMHNLKNEKFSIDLKNGDLLFMDERIQNFYKHQIAKTKRVQMPRINLTFRFIQ
jgi:alkylated DNA repair dioxygenase AlkB